jgi:hypothetical protein
MSPTNIYEAGDELELEILHFDREFEMLHRKPARRPSGRLPLTTQQLAALIEPWRLKIASEVPLPVLIGMIKRESGGQVCNATHGASERIKEDGIVKYRTFYELGLFQTPAGQYHDEKTRQRFVCRNNGAFQTVDACPPGNTPCKVQPPGREDPTDHSPWYRLCKSLGLDHKDWTNPTTQVRVGLTDLELGARTIVKRFKDLFQKRGDWYLRMALLERFAHGGGHVQQLLKEHHAKLLKLPESDAAGGSPRWEYLKHYAGADFDPKNVDAYMAVAKTLGYRPVP